MKLADLMMEKKKEEAGTYVAGKFSKDSQNKLFELVQELNIPNPLVKSEYHVTIIYSEKTISYKGLGELEEPWVVAPEKFHVFPSQSGKRCLVLKLDAPDLINQHETIMDDYKAEYSFDEYIPHVTLSYDIGDKFKIPANSKLNKLDELEIVEEYSQPINKDYVASL